MTTTWVAEPADALGSDSVLTAPDVSASYARDQAVPAPAGTPAAVVLLRSTADVVAVMQIASRHGSIEDALDPAGLLDPGTVLRRRPAATA